jgi:hypothetical protein
MIRLRLILLAMLIGCRCALSQSVLKGKVISEETKTPLSAVSVYLNNTSLGTVTDANGLFILNRIPPGKFRLVATSVGYETYSEMIDLREIPKDFIISLKTKTEELEGFSVRTSVPDGWKKYGKFFRDLIIGSTPNSNDCILENPEVVKFRLNADNTLTAYANKPLQVTNYALGYEISYKLEDFVVDLSTNLLNYSGYAFYKDLALTHPKKAAKYSEARYETYKGSLLHFMRAFYANQLDAQGFEMHNLGKISNPEKDRAKYILSIYGNKPITSVVSSQAGFEVGTDGSITHLRNTEYTVDSTDYFKKMLKQPDSVISHQLLTSDSIGFAVDSTIAGLYFRDSLEVSYKLKGIPPRYRALSKENKHETYPVSQFVFVHKNPVLVLNNGFYYKPYDVKITGFWAWWENMSTWLPYDYFPESAIR